MPHPPHTAYCLDQRLPLSGPTVSPAEANSPAQQDALARWERLVETGAFGTAQPLSDAALASIAAAEDALGVWQRRGYR